MLTALSTCHMQQSNNFLVLLPMVPLDHLNCFSQLIMSLAHLPNGPVLISLFDTIAGFHQVCARGGAGGQDEADGDPLRLLADHGVAVHRSGLRSSQNLRPKNSP